MSECKFGTDSGSLYAWSVVHVAPKGWNVPYIAGYVDLPESVPFAHIVGVVRWIWKWTWR